MKIRLLGPCLTAAAGLIFLGWIFLSPFSIIHAAEGFIVGLVLFYLAQKSWNKIN